MKIAIIGAGRQARIVYEILSYDRNIEVVAFVDNVVHRNGENIKGIPIMGDHSIIPELMKNGVSGAIVGVGDNEIRAAHYEKLKGMGLKLVNAIHPTSYIAPDVTLGSGVTIATGTIINAGVRIGNNVILNTGVIIDHEDEIEDHVYIGPGCSLAGRVTIKKSAIVGICSVVGAYVTIGQSAVIGAGSVVLEDIPDNVVMGRQRRLLKREKNPLYLSGCDKRGRV